jgi:hypothetical protein
MTEEQYKELLAIEIFKKEAHLDPDDDCDFNATDFGWSKLDAGLQDHYRSLAGHIYFWIGGNPFP